MDTRWELTKALLLARKAADAVWETLADRDDDLERVLRGECTEADSGLVRVALAACIAEVRFRELRKLKKGAEDG